ncbi:MAG: sulfite exporter TauE/SafE family protein, partial [Gemmatimonadota bacterium]
MGAALIFAAALLYSAVGHAGASGYLAVMAFLGTAPAEMRPTALLLNLLVATIGTVQFTR